MGDMVFQYSQLKLWKWCYSENMHQSSFIQNISKFRKTIKRKKSLLCFFNRRSSMRKLYQYHHNNKVKCPLTCIEKPLKVWRRSQATSISISLHSDENLNENLLDLLSISFHFFFYFFLLFFYCCIFDCAFITKRTIFTDLSRTVHIIFNETCNRNWNFK